MFFEPSIKNNWQIDSFLKISKITIYYVKIFSHHEMEDEKLLVQVDKNYKIWMFLCPHATFIFCPTDLISNKKNFSRFELSNSELPSWCALESSQQ